MKHITLLVVGAVALNACALIDEDMGDCNAPFSVEYELQLVTNLTTELQTQLSLSTGISVSSALKTKLQSVFTDHAHDVDLSFYDVSGDSLRLYHVPDIIDDSQNTYTLRIPVRKYMHLAVANVMDNQVVHLRDSMICHKSSFHQVVQDTIGCHKTGLFSARQPMDVQAGVDQQFDVHLYMANCATSIIMDTVGSGIRDARVFLSGFATDFDIADSTYRFEYTPIIRPEKVEVPDEAGAPVCYASVNFPSRDIPNTKVVIEGDEPFASDVAGQALWQIRVYCTLDDGSTTETILGMLKPLRPGQFKLVRVSVKGDGSAIPVTPSGDEDPTVAVGITLDWHSGLVIDVPL